MKEVATNSKVKEASSSSNKLRLKVSISDLCFSTYFHISDGQNSSILGHHYKTRVKLNFTAVITVRIKNGE